MRHAVQVRDRANHQNRHPTVQPARRVTGRIDKNKIRQPQHQAWDRHWQQHKQLQHFSKPNIASRFFNNIGTDKNNQRAKTRCKRRHPNRIRKIHPTHAFDFKLVVGKGQAKVVRPEFNQRGKLRHPQHACNENRNGDTPTQKHTISPS